MPHIINLENYNIELSIKEEEYLLNYEYIDETIRYFIIDEQAISGTFGYEDVSDTRDIKALLTLNWKIVKNEKDVKEDMILKIEDMIKILTNESDDSALGKSKQISTTINIAEQFISSIKSL